MTDVDVQSEQAYRVFAALCSVQPAHAQRFHHYACCLFGGWVYLMTLHNKFLYNTHMHTMHVSIISSKHMAHSNGKVTQIKPN